MGVLDLVPNDKADKIRSRRYGRRRSAANPVYSGGIYVSSAEPDNTKRLLPPELLGFVDIPTKRPRGDKFCFRLKKMKHFPVMKKHFLGFCIKRVDLMFLSFSPRDPQMTSSRRSTQGFRKKLKLVISKYTTSGQHWGARRSCEDIGKQSTVNVTWPSVSSEACQASHQQWSGWFVWK